MSMGQQVQVLSRHAFFASILRIGLQGQLGICEPTVQRFGINAQTMTRLFDRDNDHETTPFGGRWNKNKNTPGDGPGKLPGKSPATRADPLAENCREFSREISRQACRSNPEKRT